MQHSVCVLGLLFICLAPLSASPDTLELFNGRTVEGEVLEDIPGQPLSFRYKADAEWKTRQVQRDQVIRYKIVPGNQADEEAVALKDTSPRTESDDSTAEAGPSNEATSDGSAAARSRLLSHSDLKRILAAQLPPPGEHGGELVVMTLTGPFATANLHRIGEVISYPDVAMMMDLAMGRHPAAIVLAINSGGGLISEMDKVVELLIERQSSPYEQRVVAWVDLGGSAAAVTALTCKELIMFPTGRLGSATTTLNNERVPEPQTALDQKLRAMQDARRRQTAALTGRVAALQEAMEFPEKRLWAHESKGFSQIEPEGDGWVALDNDEDRPLALAADELVKYGVAKGIAGKPKEVLAILGLPEDTAVVLMSLSDPQFQREIAPAKQAASELYAEVSAVEAAFVKKLEQLWDNLIVARRSAQKIMSSKTGYSKNDLQSLRSALVRCRIPEIENEPRACLEQWAPDLLGRYEKSLDFAKGKVSRALKSTRVNTDSLPIAAIDQDLDMALDWIFFALHGEFPKKE